MVMGKSQKKHMEVAKWFVLISNGQTNESIRNLGQSGGNIS